MTTRHADAHWSGDLPHGSGTIHLGSGALQAAYSAGSRFGAAGGTNPEELLGAAQAGCYAMALSATLTRAGHAVRRIDARAQVHLESRDGGYVIPRLDLQVEAEVDGLDEEAFQRFAREAKAHCPVANALRAEVVLQARLAAPVR